MCAAFVSGYIVHGWWTSRPEYSYTRIREAIQSHDLELFRRHVDLANLSNNLVDDMLTHLFALAPDEEKAKLGPEGLEGEPARKVRSLIAEWFLSEVEKYIETGTVVNVNRPEGMFDLKTMGEKWGSRLEDVKYAKVEGKIALLGFGIYSERLKKEFVAEVKMRKVDDHYWRVTEFANVSAYIDSVIASEKAEPAHVK